MGGRGGARSVARCSAQRRIRHLVPDDVRPPERRLRPAVRSPPRHRARSRGRRPQALEGIGPTWSSTSTCTVSRISAPGGRGWSHQGLPAPHRVHRARGHAGPAPRLRHTRYAAARFGLAAGVRRPPRRGATVLRPSGSRSSDIINDSCELTPTTGLETPPSPRARRLHARQIRLPRGGRTRAWRHLALEPIPSTAISSPRPSESASSPRRRAPAPSGRSRCAKCPRAPPEISPRARAAHHSPTSKPPIATSNALTACGRLVDLTVAWLVA